MKKKKIKIISTMGFPKAFITIGTSGLTEKEVEELVSVVGRIEQNRRQSGMECLQYRIETINLRNAGTRREDAEQMQKYFDSARKIPSHCQFRP